MNRTDFHRRRLRILARMRRWTRRFGRAVLASVLLLVLAVLLIAQTGRGQDLALGAAMARVENAVAGELTVRGVRSGTLLTGATLTGVQLVTSDGRPFLSADSVELRYSIAAAITGGPPIRSTIIWGLDLEVSKYTADQPMNLTRLLVAGEPVQDTVAARDRRFSLGRVGVRNGRVRVLTPAPDRSDPRVVRGPNDEPLRLLALDSLDLDLEEAELTLDAAVQFEARLASFSSAIGILDEPLRVRQVIGRVRYGVRGIEVVDAAYRLEGSLLRGDVTAGPASDGAPWTFHTDLTTDGWGDLADVHWVDERIPDGRFRGSADIRTGGGLSIEMDRVEVELEASRVVFDGHAHFEPELSVEQMHVTANPITLERLVPWIGQPLPLEGWLSGEATFSGTLDELDAQGRVTLVPTGYPGGTTTADFSGRVIRGENPGAVDVRATLDPLNYTVLEAFWPGVPWGGVGYATVELDGRVDDGLQVGATLTHRSTAGLDSNAEVRGSLWRGAEDGEWITQLAVDLLPLSVGVFDGLAPDLDVRGTVAGPMTLDGTLDSLDVSANLTVGSGRIRLDGTIDVTDPASGYRLEAAADSVPLTALTATLPDRTTWSGRFEVEGNGFAVDSITASATFIAGRSRVGAVRVDTMTTGLRIENGILITDSLAATIGGVDVEGGGRLGLAEGSFGSSRFSFRGESLEGFRPIFMDVGDTVLVRDRLSALDQDLLRLQGIDPDTLPVEREVRFQGEVRGAASVSGTIGDLDLGFLVDVFGGAYKENEVDTVRISFTATGLPARTGEWEVGAIARGILWEGREFERGGFEADLFDLDGRGRAEIVRAPGERYRAAGAFAFDSVGGVVDLTEASAQIDELVWTLSRPGKVVWDDTSLTVDSVEVSRPGDDPMSLVVDGTLTRGGESDFRMKVRGLHGDRIMHIAQREDLDFGGHVDLDVSVSGPSEAPLIESGFRVDGGRYGAMQLSRFEGTVDYSDQSAVFDIEGWDGTRVALRSTGHYPVDLSFTTVDDRIVEAPMDVRLEADSLDAAIGLAYVTSLESVLGAVSGDVRIRGTPSAPEPEGNITLVDGAWSIEAIGVRHSAVSGEVRLRPDRTVDVSLVSAGEGQADVTGTVTLEPFRDPELDLTFTFERFPAVARADMEGLISGSFTLGGRYRRPVASGDITVDEGTIYMDELQRAAGVVDLNDPFLFAGGLAVDTTALVSQPLLAGFRNPFFDNLRVAVDLSVPRGTWLRSVETNVELNGALLVRYDRSAGDFVLIGELQAVRGSHLVLGRSFELRGGSVLFNGRPGLNPDLDIEAVSRIRRPNEPPFEVHAQVTGPLVRPVVTLTTEESGLAEEDLVSYLLFGQPSGALGGRSAASLGRVSQSNAVSSIGGGIVTYVGGAFANQVGSAIARELTLDYFSVQQSGGTQSLGAQGRQDTQIELGRYVGRDAFVVVVIRPFDTGPQNQNAVAGVRVEWALTDDYNVEGFFEDRFLRSGSQLLGVSSGLLDNQRILGVFLFREWGYGPG
jgi:TamB, inner membrane protein subunit of TAM complex